MRMSRKSWIKGCGTRISKAPVAATAQQDPQDPWSMKYLVPRSLWKDYLDHIVLPQIIPWKSMNVHYSHLKSTNLSLNPLLILSSSFPVWVCAAQSMDFANCEICANDILRVLFHHLMQCCNALQVKIIANSQEQIENCWNLKGGFQAKRLDFKCRCSSLVESRARSLETQATAKLFWSVILSNVWYPENILF